MAELPRAYRPTTDEIRRLIGRAETHPLGVDFLVSGSPDAVAAMFQVHAFVVDAARETVRLAAGRGAVRTFAVGAAVSAS